MVCMKVEPSILLDFVGIILKHGVGLFFFSILPPLGLGCFGLGCLGLGILGILLGISTVAIHIGILLCALDGTQCDSD